MIERRRRGYRDPQPSELLDYESLKAFAERLGRPAGTLVALATKNDPFSITPARREGAEWFAKVWERLSLGDGTHVRRVHYVLVSQERPVKMPDGMPYENTVKCWNYLNDWSKDARYLDLIPADHFVDRRNDEPLILLDNDARAASLSSIFTSPQVEFELSALAMPTQPRLHLESPIIPQRYHIEIWCEKTTVNDVLQQLAEYYDLNVVTGSGEISLTACVDVVERARQSGRPVRILYVSDFDPAGRSMPVAAARKIEHRLRSRSLDLDIQLRPVVLTPEQCRHYRLPRTPIKATEKRKAKFEQRFGKGATELDALEALHPGALERILEREIERYYDDTLDTRIRDVARGIERDIARINDAAQAQQRPALKRLTSEWAKLTAEHERKVRAWEKQAQPVWRAISGECRRQAPDLSAIEWPQPAVGDEDADPLFDSTRGYVEQINRYKKFQHKPVARRRAASEVR